MKKYTKTFLKEIVPVVIGILIALYINNWNEDRKDEQYISQIYSSIDKELSETSEDITSKILIQKSFLDTIDFYLENDKISLLDITLKAEGINIPSIKINSWKAISRSKIELMEYNKVSALANIEEQKEILKMKTEKFADFVYLNTDETGKNKKELMKIMMLDIIHTEIPIQIEIEKIIN